MEACVPAVMTASTCLRAVEDPHVVLVAAAAAESLSRAQSSPIVLHFVTELGLQLIVWIVDVPGGVQRIPVPAQAGHDSPTSVVGHHFAAIRQQLQLRLDRFVGDLDRETTREPRLAVLDP